MIALLVCGILFGTAFIVYEAKFAPFPVMPRRVLNRTLVCMCLVNFFYWFSYYTSGIYQSSWVYVVTDWSDRDYVVSVPITDRETGLITIVLGQHHQHW